MIKIYSSIVFSLLILLGCYLGTGSDTETVDIGTGSETETAILKGTIVDEEGHLVENVRVTVVNRKYNPLSSKSYSKDQIDTVFTDRSGKYYVDTLIRGSYNIISQKSGYTAYSFDVLVDSLQTEIVADTLRKSGTIQGKLNINPTATDAVYMGFYGTPFTTKADVNGSFKFDNMPGGFYKGIILEVDREMYMLDTAFTIKSGQDIVLERELNLERKNYAIKDTINGDNVKIPFDSIVSEDSLILVMILKYGNYNGNPPGVVTESGRIVELNLNGLGLDSIHHSVNELTYLYALDLSNNNLSGVPSLGKMEKLHKLDISNNQITSLPDDFASNNIIQGIFLNHNRICETSEALFKWITNKTIDENWAQTQNCKQ